MEFYPVLIAAVEEAAKSVAPVPEPPPAPVGAGAVDWIIGVLLIWGLIRGYQRGFTGEFWSVLGGMAIVAAAFFGFQGISPLLGNLYGNGVAKEWVDWISFMGITFLVLLVYELAREKLLGRVHIFLRSTIESVGGAIVGGVRMVLFVLWLLLAIFLMPSNHVLHYWFGYTSQVGYWIVKASPIVEDSVQPSYIPAQEKLADWARTFGLKEYDVETGQKVLKKK